MSELIYSNEEELRKLALQNGLMLPNSEAKKDSEIPLIENSDGTSFDSTLDDEGAIVAEKIRQFSNVGWRPTKEEAIKYRDFMHRQETSAWASIGSAIEQTASDIGNAALSLVGDTLTLKVPKVAGSVVEGAALGTKNWMYMWEEAKYNEDSPIHKLLYKKTGNDDEYYYNLVKTLDVKQSMDKDIREGILLPKEVDVGGVKLDLWNPATVMGISYIADPSWVMPNLGIESTLAKGMKGASKIIALNEQLANVSVWASKQAEMASAKVGRGAGKLAEQIVKTEEQLVKNIEETTGQRVFIGDSGKIVDKNDLGRGAMTAAGLNQLKIPAWGATTLVWGASKILQTAAGAAELAAKIAQEPTSYNGLRLSERLAMQSENASVRNLAGTWAKTGSPFVEWVGNTTRTSLHSAMYGGAFGFTFGGEEGFYHGIGSGFTIGSAFHQIGAIHGAVAGADAPREVMKNFLWATEGYDFYNKEGTMRMLDLVEKEHGEFAKLKLMGEIAATERLQRDTKKVIYTEERIKEMLGSDSPEWAQLKKEVDDNPDFGGVAFKRTLDGQKVIIINADRAYKFAAKEELFHTLLLDGRYGLEFQRHALDSLVGTEDSKGALFRIPKEQAIRALEQFKDAYLGLEEKASGGDAKHISKMQGTFDEIIQKFKNGETDGKLNKLFEEFLASYWNAYLEDKPLDYLLKGGDLGLLRNAIETAKDAYKNTMHQDLRASGAKFNFGKTIEGFWTDQNTGKRIIIPELEKLMKHFVQRSSKEMYRGWVRNERKMSSVESAIANGLDHLVIMNPDGSARMATSSEESEKVGKGLKSAIERIAELAPPDRGLVFTREGADGESKMSFSKPKKKKKSPKKKQEEQAAELLEEGGTTELNWGARQRYNRHWDSQAEALKEQDKAPITKKELRETEKIAGEAPDSGGWSTDRRKKFWSSVWNGNPRISVKGVATKKELAILEEYLPHTVVNKFRHLNAVIEMSRMGSFAGGVSNILTAEVLTETQGPYNKVSAREEGPFLKQRNFQPAEIQIYFERKRTKVSEDGETSFEYQSGEPHMLCEIIDHDAILTRVDHFYDELRGDIDYKEVRKLFSSKEDLYIAAKSLLSRYSNSKIAEGGIAIFRNAGAVSARDAGRMRTIVNGVLGFHPTKMQMRAGEYANPWHELQLRKASQDAGLPQVIKHFRVDRIGRMRSRDGEGFFYDHTNALPRSQYNYSPSKSFRDHEGNPMSKAELVATRNSVYRNKEGEILSVYSLNKALSKRYRVVGDSVFDYVDESFGGLADILDPRMRGRQVTSDSGWLHYTPDMGEASFNSNGKMSTGYIDTTRHLDISNISHNATPDVYIKEIAQGLSRITGKDVDVHLSEILSLKDIQGRKLSSLIEAKESPFNKTSELTEAYIFTKDMSDYFKKNDIHSLEYLHWNPVRQHETSAIAVWDNGRFIENRSRASEANYFAFSPSKKREIAGKPLPPDTMLGILEKKLSEIRDLNIIRGMSPDEAVLEGLLRFKLDENGEWVENPSRITEIKIQQIIAAETTKYEQLLGKDLGKRFFDEKGRAEINQQLKPMVMKSLRKEMQYAPTKIISEIADIALAGITAQSIHAIRTKAKPVGEKGRGRTQDMLEIRDTVLGRYKKHYWMTADKIKKGYQHSLFEAVEMTEGEWQLAQKIPEFLTHIKNGTHGQWIADNLYTIHKLFGEYGGLKGFYEMHQGREKDIFLLMEKSLQRDMEDTGGNKFKVLNNEALKELYAERTRRFVYEMLSRDDLSDLNRKGLLKTYQKYRNIAAETAELRATFKSYNDAINAFIKDEFHQRVADTLTALNIYVGPNPQILDLVRAQMYHHAKQGLYKLGSYDAIANSVHLYYEFSKEKGIVLNTRLALKRNLIESLTELEKKGFVGISFVERPRPYKIINGEKVYGFHTIDFISPEKGKIGDTEAFNVWDFDGTFYKVIEGLYTADKSVLKLIDTRTGREIITEPVSKEDTPERQSVINQFIKEATARLHQEEPTTVLNRNFGKIDGPLKSYVLLNYEIQEYGMKKAKLSVDFRDWSDYELYKNGNYFVAVRKFNKEKADQETSRKIIELKDELSQGYRIITSKDGKKSVRKKLSEDDILDIRQKITELQGKVNKDFGVVLEMDELGKITAVDTPVSLTQQNLALQKLRSGKIENTALQFYVTELYKDYAKTLVSRQKKEQEKIKVVLSEGKEGNIAKIKLLEARVREAESEMKNLIGNKIREMNSELKKAGIKREVTAIEAYKRIKQDIDALRKNSDNANSRVIALEKTLFDIGAFPEYDGMSPEKQRIFRERISEAGTEEWIQNPLTGKLELTQSDWVQRNIARLQGEGNIQYATRLRGEYAKQRNLYNEYYTRYTQLSEIVDRKTEAVQSIEDQLVFLVRQFGQAKGIIISEKNALDLITSSKVNDEINNVTTIDVSRLKKFTGKKTEPKYLPDSDGVLPDKKGRTGNPERYETVEDYKRLFAHILANVSDGWQGSSSAITRINTLIEKQGILKRRGEFQEAKPKESEYESPRQFREALEVWQERKTAFENNYLEVLGSRESTGTTQGKPYKAVGLDGLPIKRVTQKSTHETNARLKEIMGDTLVEWNRLFDRNLSIARSRKTNTEFDFSTEFESLLSESNKLSFKQESWARDPLNRERVLELQDSFANGDITEAQLIQTIKDEAYLTSYGQEGFDLMTADTDLTVVRNRIIQKLDRIDSIRYGEYREAYDSSYVYDKEAAETAIRKIEQSLAEDRQDEAALLTRIDNIINGVDRATAKNRYERAVIQKERISESIKYKKELVADMEELVKENGGRDNLKELIKYKKELENLLEQERNIDDEIRRTESSKDHQEKDPKKISLYNSEEFRSLVERVMASRKIDAQREIERVRANKERVELAKRWASDYKKFLDMFREDAKELGISSPEIIVSPNNPRTRHLYNAFARITSQLYGTMHPLDWSGSGYNFEYTEKGEQLVKFRSAQDPAGQVAFNETQQNRRVYTVADYMYFASKRAEYHMLHPDAPMSAEDYMLITTLVPKSKYVPTEQKVATINKLELANKRRVVNGIMDNVSIPENRQKLVRAFVNDGLSLVISQRGERLRALQRISGMDDAKWNEFLKGKTEDEILKSAMTREVVENAFYWITDGYIPITGESEKTIKMQKRDGTFTSIRTKQMDIQRLIEFEEFRGYMDEALDSQNLVSMFDTMPYAKAVYESMAPEDRMQLDMGTYDRLALENSAEMLRQQREVYIARGEKPIWFGGEFHRTKYTGHSRDTLVLEQERIGRLISETAATEASIQKYKADLLKFCQTRTRAVENLLSLKDDVSFPDLTFRETDGIVKEADSWKESKDGRYIIQRVLTEKKGETFRVYYIGETIKNTDGSVMYDIPTSRIGNVENLTQAQVLVRMFEDDVHRIKQTSSLVSGGIGAFEPLRAGDVLIARQGQGAVLRSAYEAPSFSKLVIEAYKKSGGKPDNIKDFEAIARPMYDFGETQRIVFTANGQVRKKQYTITPSREGILNKYFDRHIAEDGMVLWIQKPRTKKQAEASPSSSDNNVSVNESNPNTSNKPSGLSEPTKEQSIVSDASEFTIVSNKFKDGKASDEWDIIKNKLGYQMVRIKEENTNRSVFKLFNASSVYLGQYYDEMYAVDEIIKAEMEKLHGNE